MGSAQGCGLAIACGLDSANRVLVTASQRPDLVAENLDSLAPKRIGRRGRDRIAWGREDSKNAELGKCLLQDRMVAANGSQHERARDNVAIVSKIHQKPRGNCTD